MEARRRVEPRNGRPELDGGELDDHVSMAKERQMNPVMAVDHTEDIHI